MKWNSKALASLLRFASKHSGPWDEFEGDIPSEEDARLICESQQTIQRLKAEIYNLKQSNEEWKKRCQHKDKQIMTVRAKLCTLDDALVEARHLVIKMRCDTAVVEPSDE